MLDAPVELWQWCANCGKLWSGQCWCEGVDSHWNFPDLKVVEALYRIGGDTAVRQLEQALYETHRRFDMGRALPEPATSWTLPTEPVDSPADSGHHMVSWKSTGRHDR